MVRALHVVTLSADGRELLLGATADGRPTHSVALDARLARAVRGEDPDGVSTEAALSPRDIQARLRAGATVEEVAAEAGVAVARVERFAGPVLSERAQAVAEAQRLAVRRTRIGRSALPLGTAVSTHLAANAAARPDTAEWTAARDGAGSWTIVLRVVVQARPRVARWRFDPALRELTALDPYAAQLGFVDPSGPTPVPAAPAAPKAAGRGAGRSPKVGVGARSMERAGRTSAEKAGTKAAKKAAKKAVPVTRAAGRGAGRSPTVGVGARSMERAGRTSAEKAGTKAGTKAVTKPAKKAAPVTKAATKAATKPATKPAKMPAKKAAPVKASGTKAAPRRRP